MCVYKYVIILCTSVLLYISIYYIFRTDNIYNNR